MHRYHGAVGGGGTGPVPPPPGQRHWQGPSLHAEVRSRQLQQQRYVAETGGPRVLQNSESADCESETLPLYHRAP